MLDSKKIALTAIGFGAAALFASTAWSAPGAAVARYDDSVVPHPSKVQVVGDAAPTRVVHFAVALKLRDAEGLTRKNQGGVVQTYAQLEAQHLPTQADYDRVVSWLKGQGFAVDATSPQRLSVQASGTVAQIGKAMGVSFSTVKSEGKTLVSANNAPLVPASLAGVVQSINGLQPELRLHTLNRRAVHPDSKVTDLVGYPASTFVNAYSGRLYSSQGEGSTTAIVIDTFPLATDLQEYWTLTKTPQTLDNVSFIQAVQGVNDPPEGEESMDTEITSSVAPKSKVRVYASSTLDFKNIDKTFERIISDIQGGQAIDQISISLGACESEVPRQQENTDDNYFAVLSSLGASIFVSSGDSGSLECDDSTVDTPSFFSTSPNVTAVGGTSLHVDKTLSAPYSETSWDGSGGGISQRFKKPAYQASLTYKRRAVPDVSADADPNTGAMVILAGVPLEIGGTSLSAPIWAGLTALVNSNRHANGKGGLGLINATTTGLVSTTSFRDVTEGNNGGYEAGPGFDLVTGVGSPLLQHLGPKLEAKP